MCVHVMPSNFCCVLCVVCACFPWFVRVSPKQIYMSAVITLRLPRRQLGNRFSEERECREGKKNKNKILNRQERDGPLGIGGE